MNAVEQRVRELQGRWEEFIDSGEAMLVWQADDQRELRMVDGFVAMQLEEHEYHTGDVFFTCKSDCTSAEQYASDLIKELVDDFEQSNKDAKEHGYTSIVWSPPERGDQAPSAFVATVWSSLAEQRADDFRHFVPDLNPTLQNCDLDVLVEFIAEVLPALAPNVRVLTTDFTPVDWAAKLEENEAVKKELLDLDMDAAYVELAQSEGGEGPAYEFRMRMMEAVQAGKKGYTEEFRDVAKQTLDIARREGWHQQMVVVAMLMGGVATGDGRIESARQHYESAKQSARSVINEDEETGSVCLYQACMALGTTWLIYEEKPDEAATEYFAAAEVAAGCSDVQRALFGMEAWRMAGLAKAQSGRLEEAWEALWNAHATASDLPEEVKPEQTTLSEVGKAMLNLTEPQKVKGRILKKQSPFKDRREQVIEAFDELLGTDWRESA